MMMDDIKYDERGLVPAIVQDYRTGEVLMLAYMSRESLEKTIETGRSWFYSRSRKELWEKGATSGNIQEIESISYDCDGDCLLLKVRQKGNACHTGSRSCFYRTLWSDGQNEKSANIGTVIEKLYEKVEERRSNPVSDSYTCYLFSKGLDKILKKVGEESTEVVIAAKNRSKSEAIYEISDLLYHLTVLMVDMEVGFGEIAEELLRRAK